MPHQPVQLKIKIKINNEHKRPKASQIPADLLPVR
jgi:hypothetical protein